MPVSFLKDLTQMTFNDSLKQNHELGSTFDYLLKLYARFHVSERSIYQDLYI